MPPPVLTDVAPLLTAPASRVVGRPRYEGANIRTWIGFKHFMYLAEEAVLQYFRDCGLGPNRLFLEHGLGLEVVDSSVQLPHALQLDDLVVATARPTERQRPGSASFAVQLGVRHDDDETVALRGTVRIALVRERTIEAPSAEPPEVAGLVVDRIGSGDAPSLPLPTGLDPAALLAPAGSGSFVTRHRAPYYHCHFSDRVQCSAFIRTMESVVDDFLHDRGLAVGHLLRERGWIPVVSRARVRLHAAAHMEETIHTVFTVQDILRDTMYTATMECWAERGEQLVQVASGSIMHGYAVSRGPEAGRVAVLGPDVRRALLGERAG